MKNKAKFKIEIDAANPKEAAALIGMLQNLSADEIDAEVEDSAKLPATDKAAKNPDAEIVKLRKSLAEARAEIVAKETELAKVVKDRDAEFEKNIKLGGNVDAPDLQTLVDTLEGDLEAETEKLRIVTANYADLQKSNKELVAKNAQLEKFINSADTATDTDEVAEPTETEKPTPPAAKAKTKAPAKAKEVETETETDAGDAPAADTRDLVRIAISEKIAAHRVAIKAELTRLEAPNVSTVQEADLDGFLEFVNNL